MSAPFGSDPWLDARLRNVPLPVGMLGRLSQVSHVSNEELDAALCDVPVPAGLLDRLQRIARVSRRRVAWRELALAASAVIAVSIGYTGLVATFFAATFPPEKRAPELAKHAAGEASLPTEPATIDELLVENSLPPVAETPGGAPAPNDFPTWAGGDDLLAGDTTAGDLLPGGLPAPDSMGPALVPNRDGGRRSPRNRPSNILASDIDSGSDHLPDLEAVSRHTHRGLAPPMVAGYDYLYQLTTGERPFVSPAAGPVLASSLVPLGHDTSSYRMARHYLQAGRLPPADEIRIEDFLAVQDELLSGPGALFAGSPFSAADGKLLIRTAAGASPFGQPGLRLLQVGVQAVAADPANRAPTDLTIAVDTSASMSHAQRLEMVRQALARLSGELRPADRLTLIGFSDHAELLLDGLRIGGADSDALERLAAAVSTLRPEGATNMAAGIELAAGTIERAGSEPQRARRLVLVSDGLAQMGAEARTEVAKLLHTLATAAVRVDIIDVSGDSEVSGALADLAEAGEGRATRAADVEEVAEALSDALAGAPQIVARSASLKVTFNPQVVHAYRLVGHATTTLTGPAAAATQVDLHAGSRVSGLFEIWLKPGGGEEVATCELSWHDPAGGAPQRVTQRVSRLQFAKSFAESPLSLQAAALAAETARVLTAHAAPAGRGASRVLEVAREAHPRLRQTVPFGQMLELLSAAEKARAAGAGRRTAVE